MGKDRIPDWLNSSLWSTTLSDDDRLHRYSPSPTTSSSAVSWPIFQPPVPVPPPAAASSPQSIVTSPKSEFRDQVDKNSNDHSNDNDQNASSSGVSPDDISRQAQLLTECQLSKKVVNLRELRRIASQGIPDGAGIRSTVWKLLLGYLPPDCAQWSSELAKKRSEYKQFKQELLMNPTEITRKLEKSSVHDNDHSKSESSGLLSRSQVTHGEHPLSLGESSIWNQFFQESEIVEQIDRDLERTHPDMDFFSGDSQLAKSNQDALKDILIVFAKLNPGCC